MDEETKKRRIRLNRGISAMKVLWPLLAVSYGVWLWTLGYEARYEADKWPGAVAAVVLGFVAPFVIGICYEIATTRPWKVD